jgi:hypothetical protein
VLRRITTVSMSAVTKSAIQSVSKFPFTLTRQNRFALSNTHQFDIADGIREFLLKKNYDLNFLLQSEPSSRSTELGIDEYVVKLVIDAAERQIRHNGH